MLAYTTRTDEVSDTNKVDIGFHYPIHQPCKFCDFHTDGIIDENDVAEFTSDPRFDFNDLSFLMYECLFDEDVNNLIIDDIAPVPNPSEWKVRPYHNSATSVTMEAKTANDYWFDYWDKDVEYYFECIYGNGHDRDWDPSPVYTDTGLTPYAAYGYRVRARDAFPDIPDDGTDERGNKTEWSTKSYSGGPDKTPPAPAPIIISAVADVNSITLLANTSFDDNGVEYYFDSIGGTDSGWIEEPNYTDPNLIPDTEYGYRVMARDDLGNQTDWSDIFTFRTLEPEDMNAPTPNPMEWDATVDANNWDGRPHEVSGGGGTFDFYAEMTAIAATDDSGGTVWYFFECTTESGFNSGWITENIYSVLIGRSGQGLAFRVKAKDEFGNETGWSSLEVVVTEPRADEGEF
jgi:hypothetical protein